MYTFEASTILKDIDLMSTDYLVDLECPEIVDIIFFSSLKIDILDSAFIIEHFQY